MRFGDPSIKGTRVKRRGSAGVSDWVASVCWAVDALSAATLAARLTRCSWLEVATASPPAAEEDEEEEEEEEVEAAAKGSSASDRREGREVPRTGSPDEQLVARVRCFCCCNCRTEGTVTIGCRQGVGVPRWVEADAAAAPVAAGQLPARPLLRPKEKEAKEGRPMLRQTRAPSFRIVGFDHPYRKAFRGREVMAVRWKRTSKREVPLLNSLSVASMYALLRFQGSQVSMKAVARRKRVRITLALRFHSRST